jgi:hypothetical protein
VWGIVCVEITEMRRQPSLSLFIILLVSEISGQQDTTTKNQDIDVREYLDHDPSLWHHFQRYLTGMATLLLSSSISSFVLNT